MCRTGVCRFGIGNWIFLLAVLHLFTYAQGGDDQEFRISPEPSDVSALPGASVSLPCGAVPAAAVSWRHSGQGMPTREHVINKDDKYRKQLANGTLVISSLSASLAGRYQCVAALDGVGTVVSRVATVYLAEPPKPSPPFRSLSVPHSASVLLPCGVRAPPRRSLLVAPARRQRGQVPSLTVNVSWHRDGSPLQYSTSLWQCGSALVLEAARPHHSGEYTCHVGVVGGATVAGDPIELKVTSEGDSEYPQRFIVTPQSDTVIEGATVTFDCAAIGNPKPEIVWLFNGNPIDLSSLEAPSVLSCGSLSLLATKQAAGSYTCKATQGTKHIEHTAVLTVQTPPSAASPTPLLSPARGSYARLDCHSGGSPAPTLTWLKDGEVVTPNESDLVVVNGNTLAISGVLPVDAGMFQCMASSAAGNTVANIRLVVRDPPKDIQKDTTKQKIDPKSFLNSLKTSNNMSSYYQKPKKPVTKKPVDSQKKPVKPKLNSTQDIFNSLISTSNIDLDEDFLGETSSAYTEKSDYFDSNLNNLDLDYNKDLISKDINDFDDYNDSINSTDSIYVNTFDDSFHATKGLDLDKTNNSIPAPKELKAVIVKHRFVTLSWEGVNVDDIAGYAVVCRVKGSDRKRIVRVVNSEATVGSLRPNTTYLFSVRTLTSNGASKPTQEITSQTPPLPPGAPPRLTSVSPRGHDSVLVQWTRGGNHSGTGDYDVYYTEAETGHSEVVHVPHPSPTAGTMSHLLTGLSPGGHYYIAVGSGGHMSQSKGVVMPIAVTVPTVSVEPRGAQSLHVKWSGAPSTHGYRIRYRAVGRKAETITAPADVSSVEIDNLEPGTTYQVRVCSLLTNGSGPFSEWVSARTEQRPGHVPATPPRIHSRAGRDWIYVWWGDHDSTPDLTPDPPGDEGWQLGWGRGVPDEQGVKLTHGERARKITELEPNTEYVLSLRATNSIGIGPAVYATVRTRPADDDVIDDDYDDDATDDDDGDDEDEEVLIPPVGVKAIMLSSTTAVVYWTDPTLPKGQPASDTRTYVVRWDSGSGPKRYFNATDLNCMIDELKPYTDYEFAVKMIKGTRSSPWSMVVVNRTLPALPGAPSAPRAVSAPRGADLSWDPPGKTNGPITGYVVMYAPVTGGEWSMSSVSTPRARLSLRPRTTYQVKVQARNTRGLGPSSPVLYYTTPDEIGETGLSPATSAWLWASAGGACCVMAIAAALALSLCCRRRSEPVPTSTYQKSSATAALKPPDLWIHHDQMELKHMDKSVHSSAVSAGSQEMALASSSLCLSREYSPPRPSQDIRHYVPTYVDGVGLSGRSVASGSDETAVCRGSPFRCEHCPCNSMGGPGSMSSVGAMGGMGTHAGNMGTMGSVGGVMGNMGAMGSVGCSNTCDRRGRQHHEQSALSPACSASLAHLHLHAGTPSYAGVCGDIYACAARDRERGHYVAYEPLAGPYNHRDSLSSDIPPSSTPAPPLPAGGPQGHCGGSAGPPGGGGGSLGGVGGSVGGSLPRRPLHSFSDSDHSTPTHSNRSARESSPYKKSAASSPAHLNTANRLHLGSSVPHCESELEPLTPSRSTERLQREMQNLEGLMKDLSAITQHQFHC